MILAFSGDWHIRRGAARAKVCERVLYGMVDEAAARGASLFGMAGDFYDTHPTEADVLFGRHLLEHASQRMRLLIASGNHDPPDSVTVLDAFRKQQGQGRIIVTEEPRVVNYEMGGVPLHVACLPDLRGPFLAQWAKLYGVKGTTKDVAKDVLRALNAWTAPRARKDPGPRVFLGHLTLGCARMDNDQPARAPELSYSLDEMAEVEADAYVLGHIHMRQGGTVRGVPWCYTGSPYGTDYGDLAPKSFTLLHWNGRRFDVEIVPTKAPRLVLVTGSWVRWGDVTDMPLSYAEQHATDAPAVAADLTDADVRLRYDVPLDDREAAARAAEEHRAAILAAGAIACAVDPIPARVTRSRAPLLAHATTDAEKLLAYWRATSTTPDSERRERVLGILARLQPQVPPPAPVSLLRVDALRWKGMGTLTEGALPLAPGIQALVGANRAGKSTLLACVPGALWCEGPKGDVDRLARGRDSYLEAEVTTSAGSWRVRQEVGRKQAEVWEGDTTIRKGGREPFYTWAEAHLPSRAVMEQIATLPPKRNGLLDLVDAALKAALLKLAGASRFGHLADLARKETNALEGATRQRREAIARMGQPEAAVAEAEWQHSAALARASDLRTQHARGTEFAAALADLTEATTALDWVMGRRSRLLAQKARLTAPPAVDFAVLRGELETARTALVEAAARSRSLTTEAEHARRDVADVGEQMDRGRARIAAEEKRIAKIDARLADRPKCREADLKIPSAKTALALADAALAEVVSDLDRTNHRQALTTIRDLASEETPLRTIYEVADAALTADQRQGKRRLQSAVSERNDAAGRLSELEGLAAQLADLDALDADRLACETALAEEEALIAVLDWRDSGARQLAEDATKGAREAFAEGARHQEEMHRIQHALLGEAAQGQVETELRSLAAQEGLLAAEFMAAREKTLAATAAVGALRATWTGPEPTAAFIASLERQRQGAEADAARWEERLRVRKEAVTAWQEERDTLASEERTLGDLAAFVRSVDRNGVQAFEADAIGTEIADDATDLLLSHGFRWIVRYDGQRGEKKTVEQARWTVVEQETGLEYDARASGGGSSGGQEVIVATAVFLAAGMAVVRRGGGVKDATLTIDEMTSAVREPLVTPWLAMLRDGAARVGARTVLLVPPNDDRLIAACDGVITVRPTDKGSVVE